jgi:membrane protease YdiL (CAAX protease family)
VTNVLPRLGVWAVDAVTHERAAENPTWQRFVSGCFTAPLVEEILYRMIICPHAAALAGPWGGVIASGVVFAFAHQLAGVAGPDKQVGGFFPGVVLPQERNDPPSHALHSVSNLFLLVLVMVL